MTNLSKALAMVPDLIKKVSAMMESENDPFELARLAELKAHLEKQR